ncbi:MAG TPA: hypothetical protein PLV39_14025, partial [Fimbriimonadaceae bacterium]|nr:hypothetical protein [Fimbriimonadaceae bacterium]
TLGAILTSSARSRKPSRRRGADEGQVMNERTHALEHWLRLVAAAAIHDIVSTPPDGTVHLDSLLACVSGRAQAAMREAQHCSTSLALLEAEAALRFALRAVAILLREEAGR